MSVKEPIFSASKKDFRVDYFNGTGPGGQKRNKCALACRITYIPTGETAQSTKHKSQEQNRKAAFEVLANRIIERVKRELAAENIHIKQNKTTIRTYHEKRNEVKDHRTGIILPLDKVLNGNIDKFIEEMLIKETKDD